VASIPSGGSGLTLTDTTGGAGTLSLIAENSSLAIHDLGLDSLVSGNILTGRAVAGGLDTVLLSTLRGGQGLNLGIIGFTDRSGRRPASKWPARTRGSAM